MSPIVRGLRPSLFAAVVLSLSAPLPAAGAVALPDTGLFAPVARQYRARLEAIRRAPEPAAPGVLRLLLATGQPDEAARRLAKLTGEPRGADVMRARVALARQDFAALEPVRLRIMDGPMDREDERGALFSWRFATDDAAAIDELTRDAVAGRDDARAVPELLAAGRLAYDRLAYARAESCFTRVLAAVPRPADEPAWGSTASAHRAAALAGLGLVQQKRRDWDGSLVTLREALEAFGGADVLMPLTETLIRLGRTDEAISAAEWAVALAPYNDAAHYLLGNGYARKNYTQLAAAYPRVFADAEIGRAHV